MLHVEAYALQNALCCAMSLLLGGRLAGLSTPRLRKLLLWSLTSGGLACMPLLCAGLALPVLLLGLPASAIGCYRDHGRAACWRAAVMTLCASLLLGGVATALARVGSCAALWIAAATCALLCPTLKLLPTADVEVRQIELRRGEHVVLLPAMLDSGNLLRDPLTGSPVIVVGARAVRPLAPELSPDHLPVGFRLLNVRTAAGSSLLPVFRPDVCRLYVNGQPIDTHALVAVAPQSYDGVQALVPTAALPMHTSFATLSSVHQAPC